MQSAKRGKHTFELQMQNKSAYLFAAETEADMDSWVSTLKRVIAQHENNQTQPDKFSKGMYNETIIIYYSFKYFLLKSIYESASCI